MACEAATKWFAQ